MKMAIASTPSASGKTVLITSCLGMLSNIRKTPTYVVTTGSFRDYYSLVTELGFEGSCSTQELLSAVTSRDLESALSFATSLTQDGLYTVCSLDGAGTIESKVEAYNGLGSMVQRDDVIATEISNEADPELNKAIVRNSDLLLIVTNAKHGMNREVNDLINKFEYEGHAKVIVTKWNPVITTKNIDGELGKGKYMLFSYNQYIEKTLFSGQFLKLIKSFRKRTPEARTTPQEICNILNLILSPKKFPEVSRW